MPIIAGDLTEISVDHPELGGRTFEFKSTEDINKMKGGFQSDDDDSSITSKGTRIDKQNFKAWSLECTIGVQEGDFDYIADLAANPQEGTWLFTHVSGEISTGSGKPVGDIAENKQAGTMTLKIAGSYTLEKQ